MQRSSVRWATAFAAAALIALPASVLAQTNPTQNPPTQNPPAQTQPPEQQPPATAPQTSQASAPASGQVDAASAKQHLTEARNALSQMTSMPEAAKLQGEARTKVSELISNFNALITTQTDWRASDAKVNDSLTALLGPDADQTQTAPPASGIAGATGTTGTAPSVQVDPAIRSKLVEFRTHLKEFEKAAGSAEAPSPAPTAAASNDAPPAAAPPTTTPPSTPPSSTASSTPPSSTTPPAAAASSAAASATPSATGATGSSEQNVNEAARAEFAAIDAILAKSKTGALTKTETSELKQHIEALRALLK